jgi:hypothetical protein
MGYGDGRSRSLAVGQLRRSGSSNDPLRMPPDLHKPDLAGQKTPNTPRIVHLSIDSSAPGATLDEERPGDAANVPGPGARAKEALAHEQH